MLAETQDPTGRLGHSAARRYFGADHGDRQRQLTATKAALKRNRAPRNRVQATQARQRSWQVERRKRTRRLIELGGLVVKAGVVELTGDDRAMIFGAMFWMAGKLQGEGARAVDSDGTSSIRGGTGGKRTRRLAGAVGIKRDRCRAALIASQPMLVGLLMELVQSIPALRYAVTESLKTADIADDPPLIMVDHGMTLWLCSSKFEPERARRARGLNPICLAESTGEVHGPMGYAYDG